MQDDVFVRRDLVLLLVSKLIMLVEAEILRIVALCPEGLRPSEWDGLQSTPLVEAIK